jgi:predicted enzyme related to lactoylglutathione lyase
MDKEWVKIYRTLGGSSIGAVKEGRGFHKTSPSKPVMITWAVDNIQPWYERVVKSGVKVLKAPQVATDPPAKSFLVADPTGYTFEFLEWVRE